MLADGEQIQRYVKRWRGASGLLAQNATTPGDITVQELVARRALSASAIIYRWRSEMPRRRQPRNRYHLTGDAA